MKCPRLVHLGLCQCKLIEFIYLHNKEDLRVALERVATSELSDHVLAWLEPCFCCLFVSF
jgi:hypothetical protein